MQRHKSNWQHYPTNGKKKWIHVRRRLTVCTKHIEADQVLMTADMKKRREG